MGMKESLQKLIDRKQAEIEAREAELRDAKVYLQALQDSFRLIPKDSSDVTPQKELRAGSAMARVQAFLKERGQPEHISVLLEFLGKANDKANRVSLTGSLAAYAKDGRIFTKPAPNTFGLLEFGEGVRKEMSADDLPEEFGKS